MTIMVTYPHDPAGTRDECHIQDESHIILTNDNTYRVIVPEMAPFFKVDLRIIHAESNLELEENKDYNLGYRLLSAKRIAQRDLYGCIVLTNPKLKGEFIIEYRTVGGNFVGIRSNVLTYLANALNDPVKTPFEKVLERPSYFTPHKHEQHYADFVNKNALAAEIDGLADAIDDAVENADADAVGVLLSRISGVNILLDRFRQDTHNVDYDNPHGTTYQQVNALGKNESAADTFRAYSKSLVELAEYINSRGITEADVQRYLAKYGEQSYENNLILKDGQAVIRNGSATSTINLSSGDITISADRLLEFLADSDRLSAGEKLSFMAGANKLEIISSGSGGSAKDKLLFNGHEVIHGGTVRDKVAGKNKAGINVTTQDSDTIEWDGYGHQQSPLSADMRLPVATLTKRGTVMLTNSRNTNNRTQSPSPYVLNELRKDADSRVPKTRTVNDYPLSSNVTITKRDLDLDLVENTADKDKPISTAQQALLDKYSDKGHKHDVSDAELVKATSTKLGVVKHATNLNDADPVAVTTPKMVSDYAAKLVDVATMSLGKLPADVLDIRYWGASRDVVCNGLAITFPPNADLYMNRVNYSEREDLSVPGGTIDIGALYPDSYLNETFYIYIIVDGDNIYYDVSKEKLPNAVGRLHISTVKCGVDSILNMSSELNSSDHMYDDNVGGVLSVDPVTSVGMFRELEEHMQDPAAHGGDEPMGDAVSVGLDLIKNYPVVSQISDGSHNGIDEWEYFTGWNVDHADEVVVQPNATSNNGLDVSNGVMITIPWSEGGTEYLAMRNRQMKFNDPNFVSDVLEDGLRKRRLGYVLNPERVSGKQSVDNWHVILGSHTDEAGDVIDIVLWHSYRFYDEKQVWLRVYRNGVYERNLSHVNIGNWKMAPQHSRLYLILEYWQTADGFHYGVEWQYDAMSITSRLDRVRVDLDFRDDGFDMNVAMSQLGERITHYTANGENTNQSYVYGNIKKAVDSGVIGFSGKMYDVATVGSVNSVLLYIDCIAADEGNLDKKYINAKGVYQSLRDGVNMLTASGKIVNGQTMPLVPNCRYVNVYLGWNTFGNETNGTDPIDGLNIKLRSVITGNEIQKSRLDILNLEERYIEVEAKYKTESQGSAGPIDKIGTINYLIAGLRDV